MEQEEAYFTPPAFIGSAEARKQVGKLMQKALFDPSDLDKLFRSAIEACKRIG